MSKNTLFDRVWGRHVVPNPNVKQGLAQFLISDHFIHEVTSAPAFEWLRKRGLPVRFPHRNYATVDHIIPTTREGQKRPFLDLMADDMMTTLQRNCQEFGIKFFGLGDENQGIVHIIGPQLGITQPGRTIACGDSHTSTHGAFGSIAFGIGTTQVFNVLASGCLLLEKPKVRQILVTGVLRPGVYAKDIILAIIGKLGVKGGIGYAYEYAGSAIRALGMEGRMTVCNMSIEGGATCGYIVPDLTTINYLRGRPYAPQGQAFERAAHDWMELDQGENKEFDDIVRLDGSSIAPMITWGTNPGQVVGVTDTIPHLLDFKDTNERKSAEKAMRYMGLTAGQRVAGIQVQNAFIGSCTNGRMDDLREAARLIQRYNLKVASHVEAIVVPGSEAVRRQAEAEGLHEIFIAHGYQWRLPGCSMCLGMNPDQVEEGKYCISTSNRNFEGRQGVGARTLLMSPASVVVSAAAGEVTDVRSLLAA